MNQHLSPEEISEALIGAVHPQREEHARECPVCRAELTRLQTALSAFRASVRGWSEQGGSELQGQTGLEFAAGGKAEPARSRCYVQPLRWALIAALLLVVAAIPIHRNATNRHREAELASDALLMEQVDAALARAVPAPLEPLARLVPLAPDSQGAVREEQTDTAKHGGVR